jgi:hypothetical protein
LIYLDRLWLFVGSAPIRLSTIATFLAVFVFVAWRFRASKITALYNGLVATLFTFFLYEVLFNITGRFPPTDVLPVWGLGVLVCSMLLGILQAWNHFVRGRLPMILLSAFLVDWLAWVLIGFPFNLPSTQPVNLVAEALNVSTKLLLPFGYATGLQGGGTPVRTRYWLMGSNAPAK